MTEGKPYGACSGWFEMCALPGEECRELPEGSVCAMTCTDVNDCPPPSNGDALPLCVESSCVLFCGNPDACPDGMVCVEWTCLWDD